MLIGMTRVSVISFHTRKCGLIVSLFFFSADVLFKLDAFVFVFGFRSPFSAPCNKNS